MMAGSLYHWLERRRLLDRILRAFFLCCPVVDLASPFSRLVGGLGVTFRPQPGGLGVTFLESMNSSFCLYSIVFALDDVYAKVLFTNLIETKAGQSPVCLKENSIGDQACHRSCCDRRLTLQKKCSLAKSHQTRDERRIYPLGRPAKRYIYRSLGLALSNATSWFLVLALRVRK